MKILLVGFDWFGKLCEFTGKALAALDYNIEYFYYNKCDNRQISLLAKVSKRLGLSKKDDFRAINELLLSKIDTTKPDLVFIIKGEFIYPETIKQIKTKYKLPVISWWLDSPFIYAKQYPYLIDVFPLYDCMFVFDAYYVPLLKEIGVRNAFYLPNACEPAVYKKMELSGEEIEKYGSDLSFVGSYYPRRKKMLEGFLRKDLKIWGPGWSSTFETSGKIHDGAISVNEAAKVYNASKINLNFHRPQVVSSLNPRTFEIAASGSFQLIFNKPEAEIMFDLREEMICYSSLEELRIKSEFYLNNPEKRKEIALRAQNRVLHEHTYAHRMHYLREKLQEKL